jgi:alpha,alpha-trehalose phosphorylase
MFRGRRVQVETTKTHATYTLLDGAPLEIAHHGKALTISVDGQQTEAIPPIPARRSPTQPRGRAPARRGNLQPA